MSMRKHADHFRMLIFVPAFMKPANENGARYYRFNSTKRGTVTTMVSKVKRLLIGRPMKSNELDHEKLSKVKALAVLSSDALSSVAYGTEQILIVLVAAGFTAIWYSLPIALAVLGLLAILIFPIARLSLPIRKAAERISWQKQSRRSYRPIGWRLFISRLHSYSCS